MTAGGLETRTGPAAFTRNIPRILLFQALANVSLWMPIWVIFLTDNRGLSLGAVYLIAGAGWVVMALAEVPTGVLSDVAGRRVTLVTGGLVLATGLFLLAVLSGFAGLLVAYLLWAEGNALISGSDSALLYDSAVAAGQAETYSAIASRLFQVQLGAQAVGSVTGGLLGAIDLRLPILATVALTIGSVVVMPGIIEPPHGGEQAPTWLRTPTTALATVRAQPRLAALIAYGAMLSGTAFFVPFVLFQPQLRAQGVPVIWLGVLFTGLRLAAMAGARVGPRLVTDTTRGRWLLGVPVLMAAGFVAVAGAQLWWQTLAAMVCVAWVNTLVRPELAALVNRQVGGSIRATVLSLENLTMTLCIAVLHPAVGAVAERFSLSGAFLLLAMLCVGPVALTLALRDEARSRCGDCRGGVIVKIPPQPLSGSASSLTWA